MLQEIISLYRNDTIKSTLRVSEIGSDMIRFRPNLI